MFLVNGLGDQVLALPAVRALAEMFPGRIRLVLGPGMRFMFYQGLPLRSEHRARWADFPARQIEVDPIVEEVGECDLFINLTESWQTSSVVELGERLGAGRRAGYFEPWEIRIRVGPSDHMFDRHFALPAALDPNRTLESYAGPLCLSRAARGAARQLLERYLTAGERMLFVHPETAPEKEWDPEALGRCLAAFLSERSEYRAFLCSRLPWPVPGLEGLGDRVVALDTHLELSLAILEWADAFLGIDSCFLHAADLFEVPGVAVFGPTRPEVLGFRFSRPGLHLRGASSPRQVRAPEVTEALFAVARAVDGHEPRLGAVG